MRQKSYELPCMLTIFTATVEAVPLISKGLQAHSEREGLSCGTWKTEFISNATWEQLVSAALGWRNLHPPDISSGAFPLPYLFYCFLFSFSMLLSVSLPHFGREQSHGLPAQWFWNDAMSSLLAPKRKAACVQRKGDALAEAEGCTSPTASTGRRGLLSQPAA